MKINAPKENYIFIELTNEDMQKLNITFDNMDYSNVETKRVIWTLLDEAKHSLGRDFDMGENFKVEALPGVDGGCLLFFTLKEKHARYKLSNRDISLTYEFDKIDDCFDLSKSLTNKEKESVKSSLYLIKGKYFLVVTGKIKHALMMKLNEFASCVKSDKNFILKIQEYEKCLIENNALDVLLGNASK